MTKITSPRFLASRRTLPALMALAVAALAAWSVFPATATNAPLAKGLALLEEGQCEQAVPILEDAVTQAQSARDIEVRIAATVALAAAYQTLGQLCKSTELLEAIESTALQNNSPRLGAKVQVALGNALLFSRRFDDAERHLRQGLDLARLSKDAGARAVAAQSLANLLIVHPPPVLLGFSKEPAAPGEASEAEDLEESAFGEPLRLYAEAIKDTRLAGNDRLLQRIRLNRIRALLALGGWQSAERDLLETRPGLAALGDNREKTFLLTAWGHLCSELIDHAAVVSARLLLPAHQALTEAGQLAAESHDGKSASYAHGYLASLYEKAGRHAEALALSEQALFLAQRAGCPEAQFEWEWQIARLLHQQGRLDEALGAYRRAVQSLQSLRSDLAAGAMMRGDGRTFRESTGRLYFEYADLLLAQAGPSVSQATLIEARNTIELLRTAEIQDYFYDEDCVSLLQAKVRPIEAVGNQAAVVYFIPLPDRLEILLSLPDGLRRFTASVGAEQLTATVRRLRLKLQKRYSEGYVELARTLWDWLIEPYVGQLKDASVQTLVLIPDGALRTIPMSALHDGQGYLIERFAIAIAPGLSLVDPRPMPRVSTKALLCGVSKSRDDFPPLAAVPAELLGVQAAFPGLKLLDEDFVIQTYSREMAGGRYAIVHIASHGEFGSDARRSFLLAFNGRLSLDQLEEMTLPSLLSEHPIELLTLSACQTAAGDDRAALGLGGVAVKAGARSALASLWAIDDQATQRLMTEFYANLKRFPNLTTAQCLQRAQQSLLHSSDFAHPCFWSPFLVIGNWL